jgi:TP901 family phage tail tape measure protein
VNLIGSASILVTADGSTFNESLKSKTDPALGNLEKDAGASGLTAGENLAGGVSTGTKNVASDLEKTGKDAGGKFSGALSGALSMLSGGLINTNSLTDKVGSSMESAGGKAEGFAGKLSNLGGKVALGATVGFLAVSAVSVKLGLDYETTMAKIAANSNIPIQAAKKIGDAFLSTAGTTIYSAQTIAVAFSTVGGQLGLIEGHALTSTQALGFMKVSMDLAEASGVSLGSATTTLTGVMQAFHLTLGQAKTASDLLFSASRLTGTSLETEGATLDKLRAKLGAASPPMAQLTALQVDLAMHGEAGSRVLMSLTASLTGLMTPTAKVVAAQQAMGVSFIDSSGKLVSMRSIIQQVGPIIAGMGNAQATATLKSLGFGAASAKLVTTIQAGLPAYDAASAKVTAAGAAHAAAQVQVQTLGHQMELMKVTIEDLATKWGVILIPVVKAFVKVLVDIAKAIVDCKPLMIGIGVILAGLVIWWVANTVAAMAFWTAATAGIILAVAAIAVGIAWLVTHWKQAWDDIKHWFDDALNFLRSGFGTLVLLIAGPLAPLLFLALHWQQIWAGMKSVVETIWQGMQTTFNAITGFFVGIFTSTINAFKTAWDTVWNGLKSIVDTIWGGLQTTWNAITSFVSGIFTATINAFKVAWDLVWNGAKATVDLIWTGLQVTWNAIVTFVSGLFTATINAFKTAWDFVWNGAKATIDTIWGGIKSTWDTIVGYLSGAITTAIGAMGTVWNYVWNGMKSTIDNVWAGIKSVLNFMIGGINGLIAALNNIPFVNIPTIPTIGSAPPAQKTGGGSSNVPLPHAAIGGLFSKATVALIGETGPELVLSPALTQLALKSGIGPLPSLGALPGGAGGSGAQINSSSIVIQSGAFVVHVGAGATAIAATQAVQQGIAALRDELNAGRSPIRGGLSH